MNVSAASGKRLVIVGATGMVGGYALRYALEHPSVQSATAIARRKLDISHPKLKVVVQRDFTDCSELGQTLSGQDAVYRCRVGDATPNDNCGLHGRDRASSPRRQSRSGI